MKGCCAQCGHVDTILGFADEAQARECLGLALKWPRPLADSLIRYLGLFSPPKRVLAWPRVRKLLDALLADIERGHIRRHGRDWAAPQAAWLAAFEVVFTRLNAGQLTLPLKDHGYLYGVLANSANTSEAQKECEREASRRAAGATRRRQEPGDALPNPFESQQKGAAERAHRNQAAVAASALAAEERARPIAGLPPFTDQSRREWLAAHHPQADANAVLRLIAKEQPA